MKIRKQMGQLKWMSKVPIVNAPKGKTYVRGRNAQKRLRKLAGAMMSRGQTMLEVSDACARDIALIMKHNPPPKPAAPEVPKIATVAQQVRAALS